MPYNTSTGRMTAPVSIPNLRTMFGTSVNVIAPKNAINQCLCKMSSINRWSRHKPVSWPHLFRNAIQTTHPTDYEQWWMGKDGDYNINYDWTEIQGTGANPSDIFAQRARFTLKNIDGNDGDVARLSDYEDYVHYPARFYSGGAVAPVSIAGMDFNGKIDPPANQASAYATFQVPTCATNDSEGKSLLLTYMDVLGMYYIGFCLRVKINNAWSYLYYTTDKPVNSIAVGETVESELVSYTRVQTAINISLYLKSYLTYFQPNRECEIIPIISTAPLSSGGTGLNGNLVAPLLFNVSDYNTIHKTATLSYYGSDASDVGYVEPTAELVSANITTSSTTYTATNIKVKFTSRGGSNAGQPYIFYLSSVYLCKFRGTADGTTKVPVSTWGIYNYAERQGQTVSVPLTAGSVVEQTLTDPSSPYNCSAVDNTTVDSRLTKIYMQVSLSFRCYLNVTGAAAGAFTTVNCYKYFKI